MDCTADTLKIVTAGSVDHGKSTLLECLWRNLSPDSMAARPDRRIDGLAVERELGFTLDTAQVVLEANGRTIAFIDVPGHPSLLKNMVTGASRADAAILVLDVTEGVTPQTGHHVATLQFLGIDLCVVACNKLDQTAFRDDVFARIAGDARALLKQAGVRTAAVVPIAALYGDNVVHRSEAMPWYRGPTLIDAVCGIEPRSPTASGVRFRVQDCLQVGGEPMYVGRVEVGTLRREARMSILPGDAACRITTIERYREPPLESASAGECVGVRLSDGTARRGDVLSEGDAPMIGGTAEARLLQLAPSLERGEPLRIRIGSAEAPCRVTAIRSRLDSASAKTIADTSTLRYAELAAVTIDVDGQIAFDAFETCPPLGYFVLIRANSVIAAGIMEKRP